MLHVKNSSSRFRKIQNPPRGVVKMLLTAAVIGFAAMTIGIWSAELDNRASQPLEYEAAKTIPVATKEATQETGYIVRRILAGQIEASRTASMSFELPGRLRKVSVREGDLVQKGQILATQDVSLLLSERDQLEFARDGVEAQMVFARQTLRRNTALSDSGTIPAAVLNETRARVGELAAQLGEISAQLENVALRLDKSVLIAPFDGQVTEQIIRDTEMVASGQTLLTLVDLASPSIRVGLPSDINPETLVQAQIEIQGSMHDAQLITVRPDLDPVTRTRTALFKVNSTRSAYGQTAQLILDKRIEEPGIWVDVTELRENARGQWTVLALGVDDIVSAVAVEVIHAETNRAFVRGTFPAGMVLVAEGGQRVSPGQEVHRIAEHS